MLCQIEHCLRYCRKYQRTLVLDSTRSGLRDDFLKYFSIEDQQKTPVISLVDMPVDIEQLSTFPLGIKGRIGSYVPHELSDGQNEDLKSGDIINFDMKTAHLVDLLVQERAGGGINSYWILQHLQPTELLLSALKKNLAKLPSTYISVHIRNTDLSTDYESFIKSITWALRDRDVLIGTDSGEIQERLPSLASEVNALHFLTELDPSREIRLHDTDSTDETSNLEMFSDLFALAMGRRLYFTTTKQGYVSGFSGLAYGLSQSNLTKRVAKELGYAQIYKKRPFNLKGMDLFLRKQGAFLLAKLAIKLVVKTREIIGK